MFRQRDLLLLHDFVLSLKVQRFSLTHILSVKRMISFFGDTKPRLSCIITYISLIRSNDVQDKKHFSSYFKRHIFNTEFSQISVKLAWKNMD